MVQFHLDLGLSGGAIRDLANHRRRARTGHRSPYPSPYPSTAIHHDSLEGYKESPGQNGLNFRVFFASTIVDTHSHHNKPTANSGWPIWNAL